MIAESCDLTRELTFFEWILLQALFLVQVTYQEANHAEKRS